MNNKNAPSAILQVCRHTFSFSHIYADHTPVRIPFYEIVTWGATKVPSLLLFFLRLACVIFVWFIIVPFTTRRVWRMTLTIKTLAEGWDFLFDYSFTIVDSLVGLLCFVGMNMLSCICLSLIMYYSHRQPTNQRPRNGDAFVGEMELVIVLPFEVHHSTLAELFGMEGSMYPFFKRLLRVCTHVLCKFRQFINLLRLLKVLQMRTPIYILANQEYLIGHTTIMKC